MHVVAGRWRFALRLTDRLALQPALYGRILLGNEMPWCLGNFIGGDFAGHYVEQQLPFAGIGNIEMAEVTGGTFWKAYTPAQIAGTEEVPPITKLSLELNPQNLGALELTISKKGKDLQVQVVSNPTAINLFVNNQAELRANLAQMGFSNVDLNFSQNGANSGQKHQQGRRNQRQAYQASEGNENGLESHTMVITIPQYA